MGDFGALLRSHRLGNGLSQEELAHRSGLAVRTIRNLETDSVTARVSTRIRLADALQLSGTGRVAFLSAAHGAAPQEHGQSWVRQTPAELPGSIGDFTGRIAEIALLEKLCDSNDLSTRLITLIAGTAGVGKTALALHWAHRIRERYMDGQLYADLRDSRPAHRASQPKHFLDF